MLVRLSKLQSTVAMSNPHAQPVPWRETLCPESLPGFPGAFVRHKSGIQPAPRVRPVLFVAIALHILIAARPHHDSRRYCACALQAPLVLGVDNFGLYLAKTLSNSPMIKTWIARMMTRAMWSCTPSLGSLPRL